MKYVANLLVAINNVASAEAMVLGMKAGLPPQLIFDLIQAGAGNSRVFELRAPMMVKGDYGYATMKIVDLAEGHAGHRRLRAQNQRADAAVRSPPAPSTPRRARAATTTEDTAAVCAVLEKMAGVKRSGAKKR